MQAQPHDPEVNLGYAAHYEPGDLFRLNACFLPLGKVGGKPSWLDPVSIPRTEELACKSCSKPLCFLLQVYAPGDDSAPHSFHRTLFVFVCRDPKCSKPNDSTNLAVFRCCLPRVNEFYSSEEPLDPDLTGPDELPPPHPSAPSLCRVCGCFASKRCAKCGDAWYCSREHQAFDWKTAHKGACGQPAPQTTHGEGGDPKANPNPANIFLFEEMGIEVEREYLPRGTIEEVSDDDEEEEEEEEDEEAKERRFNEYLKMVKAKKLEAGAVAVDAEADEAEDKKDCAFVRFNRVLAANPEQIVRYQRAGQPLLPSDHCPPLPQVPACALCGAPRHFELQLTPHLLSLIGVDALGESIDWAAVYVYTCSANCQPPEGNYAREAVLKHDFQ